MERSLREAQLEEQVQELKGVNQYLKDEVKRLITERQEERLLASGFGDSLASSWQSGLGLGAEICFERLRLEGEMAEQRVSHHERIEVLQRNAEEQASTLTKRAATLITGVLPILGSSPASSGAESNGDGAATRASHQTLHVSSSSPEIQQQVEQLLHGYMAGEVEEDAAVDSLSRLHCGMQLLISPVQGQHAAGQNGDVSEQLKQAQMGANDRMRKAPEKSAPASVFGKQGDAEQQQQQSQGRLANSTSFRASPAGINDFTPSFGGYYSQFVLAEPEKLRRLITRASSQNPCATDMAEHAVGLPGAEPAARPEAVQGNGEASNSNSSSTWGRRWSLGGKLLSFGSSKHSGSGAVKPDAAPSTSTAPSPTLPVAPAAGPPSSSSSTATASAPASAAGLHAVEPSGGTTTQQTSAPVAASEPAPTPAPAAPPKPARAPSPTINLTRSNSNSSGNTSGKAGKGVAGAGQGALSALHKSLERQGLEEKQMLGSRELMDTHAPTPDRDEELWAQAAPLGGQPEGMAIQLSKAA